MTASGGRYSWGVGDEEEDGSSSPCPKRSPARLAALHLPAYVRRKLSAGQVKGSDKDNLISI